MKKLMVICFTLFAAIFIANGSASAKSEFKDVDTSYWALEEITYLQNLRVITGFADGSFLPGRSVTRGQAAMMMNRSLKFDTTNVVNPGFTDLSPSNAAYKDIAALVKAGVIPKTKTFRPNDVLTRAEMATYLVKGYKLKGTYTGVIKDVSADLLPTVRTLAGNGVTAIYVDNTYRPKDPVTRAQFSAFVARVVEPKFRVNYSVLHLFLPQINLNMSAGEVKEKMTNYNLVDEVHLPLQSSDHQITYAAKVTGLAQNEQFLFLFKEDKLIHVVINVDVYTSVKPTAIHLDAKFNSYQNYFKSFVGSPRSISQLPAEGMRIYDKKGTYQGNFAEDTYLLIQGYDLKSQGMNYMETYMFGIKLK